LFLAVQFIDVFWALFVLLGIEKVQLAPQLPASRLIYNSIPFTHSMLGFLYPSHREGVAATLAEPGYTSVKKPAEKVA